MINTNIRDEVRQRALDARSEKEMARIIYRTLQANHLDWREVGNENVKQLLVDALTAYRRRGNSLRVAV